MTNPQVVVVVTLNGTHGEAGFGGQCGGARFSRSSLPKRCASSKFPKTCRRTIPNPTLVAKNADDLNDLAIADLEPSGHNILQEPMTTEDAWPPRSAPLNASLQLKVRPPSPSFPRRQRRRGPRVPNFRGMTMRAVLAEAAAKGLSILPDGSGIARVQSPPPGAPLHQGERIRVQFAQ